MWWKQNKWKVIIPVIVAAVLVFAFWFGGNAPGSRGWTIDQETPAPTQSETAALPAEETPLPTETPAPQETASDAPQETRPGGDKGGMSAEEKIKAAEELAREHGTKDNTTAQPSATPAPVESQKPDQEKEYTCTISISCASILSHMDWLDESKKSLVPSDGWILKPTEVTFYEGESVFNVLQRVCKQNKIHMEFSNSPVYKTAYIEGIHNLYEFDCGELSGWMYKVDDWFPNYGCSRYLLKDGDEVCWLYTCELGADIGGYNAVD